MGGKKKRIRGGHEPNCKASLHTREGKGGDLAEARTPKTKTAGGG